MEIALSGWSEILRKLKGVKFQGCLWETEVSVIKTVSMEHLPVGFEYAVKLLITDLFKFNWKL